MPAFTPTFRSSYARRAAIRREELLALCTSMRCHTAGECSCYADTSDLDHLDPNGALRLHYTHVEADHRLRLRALHRRRAQQGDAWIDDRTPKQRRAAARLAACENPYHWMRGRCTCVNLKSFVA